jgi:hypothetical protein
MSPQPIGVHGGTPVIQPHRRLRLGELWFQARSAMAKIVCETPSQWKKAWHSWFTPVIPATGQKPKIGGVAHMAECLPNKQHAKFMVTEKKKKNLTFRP